MVFQKIIFVIYPPPICLSLEAITLMSHAISLPLEIPIKKNNDQETEETPQLLKSFKFSCKIYAVLAAS